MSITDDLRRGGKKNVYEVLFACWLVVEVLYFVQYFEAIVNI